jgi:hypothetical protein
MLQEIPCDLFVALLLFGDFFDEKLCAACSRWSSLPPNPISARLMGFIVELRREGGGWALTL